MADLLSSQLAAYPGGMAEDTDSIAVQLTSCCPGCGCPADPAAISNQIELAFDPAEPRDPHSGEWVTALRAVASRHPGVEISLAPRDLDGEHTASLSLIRTATDKRGQGLAGAAMNDLTRTADQHNVTLHLTPEPLADDHTTKVTRLRSWYASHGFKPNTGRSRDLRIRDTMIRPPATVQS